MPSEPSGSDISGFVDLPTSPTQTAQTQHTREESSTFHLFLWIFMRVYPVSNGLSQIIMVRLRLEGFRGFCTNLSQCDIRELFRSEDPISLGMWCANSIHVMGRFVYSLIRNYQKFSNMSVCKSSSELQGRGILRLIYNIEVKMPIAKQNSLPK